MSTKINGKALFAVLSAAGLLALGWHLSAPTQESMLAPVGKQAEALAADTSLATTLPRLANPVTAGGGRERATAEAASQEYTAVVLRKADGTLESSPSGTIFLGHGADQAMNAVPVHGGELGKAIKHQSVQYAILNGVRAYPTPANANDKGARLAFQEETSFELIVLDSETNEHLEGVTILPLPTKFFGSHHVAGLDPFAMPQLGALNSPIRVLPLDLPQEGWICSEGYAWAKWVKPVGRDTVTLPLEREARLDIAVQHHGSRVSAVLWVDRIDTQEPERIYATGIREALEGQGDAIPLSGLAPGDYVVSARHALEPSTVLFEETVTLAAGAQELVEFNFLEANDQRSWRTEFHLSLSAPLALLELQIGEALSFVAIPKGQQSVLNGAQRLQGIPVSQMLALDDHGSEYLLRYNQGLPFGNYIASLEPLGPIGEFTIEGERVQKIHLSMPPLAESIVEVEAHPAWSSEGTRWSAGSRSDGVYHRAHVSELEDNRLWVYSLPGSLSVSMLSPATGLVSHDFEVEPGTQHVLFPVVERTSIMLRFRQNGLLVGKRAEFWEQIRVVQENGELATPMLTLATDHLRITDEFHEARIWFTESGSFSLQVPGEQPDKTRTLTARFRKGESPELIEVAL